MARILILLDFYLHIYKCLVLLVSKTLFMKLIFSGATLSFLRKTKLCLLSLDPFRLFNCEYSATLRHQDQEHLSMSDKSKCLLFNSDALLAEIAQTAAVCMQQISTKFSVSVNLIKNAFYMTWLQDGFNIFYANRLQCPEYYLTTSEVFTLDMLLF